MSDSELSLATGNPPSNPEAMWPTLSLKTSSLTSDFWRGYLSWRAIIEIAVLKTGPTTAIRTTLDSICKSAPVSTNPNVLPLKRSSKNPPQRRSILLVALDSGELHVVLMGGKETVQSREEVPSRVHPIARNTLQKPRRQIASYPGICHSESDGCHRMMGSTITGTFIHTSKSPYTCIHQNHHIQTQFVGNKIFCQNQGYA